MAQTHLDSSAYFLELSNKITDFQKNQKIDRKNAKKLYENRSLEAELADNTLKKAKTNENSYPTKEWDKIVKKAAKAIEDAAAADKLYKDLVTKLEETRKLWEKEMKEYSIMCEQMDESRLKFLMESMWAAVNVVSKNCLDIDNGCEVIRQSLENVSIDGDMRMFVGRCQTGSEKPAPMRYEPYRSQYSSSARV
ncbi:hypothetical protein HELRODRAFT_176725 [Helobdella robusta]|uniref:F-BAR domain-containing protein n=1 Tax=Helobdella robusta TaxID=6412 RepID=T1FAU2_HELRO|nr:hypothetical protein HELRODRAFT_176725 [Helobdella robusta]ESN99558.1 hypothetical protein HELRODRAFT_176725 [Helobdella robusta]